MPDTDAIADAIRRTKPTVTVTVTVGQPDDSAPFADALARGVVHAIRDAYGRALLYGELTDTFPYVKPYTDDDTAY